MVNNNVGGRNGFGKTCGGLSRINYRYLGKNNIQEHAF